MANGKTADQEGVERFDQSFLVFMVRDFALLLVLVMVAELAVKFALVYHHYQTVSQVETQRTAELLAENVKSIMINSAGPVAARTVYPILKKNHEDLGYSIAVEPSPATVEAIQKNFDFYPRGIPSQWPAGQHHEISVDLRADEFCISCHSTAQVNDVLGHVTVRRYWKSDLAAWWSDVQITGVLSLGKTLLHTFLLYFLLRFRMEPLLALRGAVSRLAKAGSNLSFRAPVNSQDEFGELASNLNRFLDRLTTIIADLDRVLHKIEGANQQLQTSQASINAITTNIQSRARGLRDDFAGDRVDRPDLGRNWLTAVEAVFSALLAAAPSNKASNLKERVNGLMTQLSRLVDHTEHTEKSVIKAEEGLSGLSAEMTNLRAAMNEMSVLEEKMRAIADEGQLLVRRLVRQTHESDSETC